MMTKTLTGLYSRAWASYLDPDSDPRQGGQSLRAYGVAIESVFKSKIALRVSVFGNVLRLILQRGSEVELEPGDGCGERSPFANHWGVPHGSDDQSHQLTAEVIAREVADHDQQS